MKCKCGYPIPNKEGFYTCPKCKTEMTVFKSPSQGSNYKEHLSRQMSRRNKVHKHNKYKKRVK